MIDNFCKRLPGLLLPGYDLELQSRQVCVSPSYVVEVTNGKTDAAGRSAAGAIWICLGPSGSKTLERLREVLSTNICQGLDILHKLPSGPKEVRQISTLDRPEQLSQSPLIAEVLYGMHRIAVGLFKHPLPDAVSVSVPYRGGKLTHRDFTLVEYARQNNKVKLECCIVIRPPVLSKVEKYFFSLVPGEVCDIDFFHGNTSPGASEARGVILLETGWAVGSFLARLALAGLRKKWQSASAATGPEHGATLVNPSARSENGGTEMEEIDVGMAAVELLRVRQCWIQRHRNAKG